MATLDLAIQLASPINDPGDGHGPERHAGEQRPVVHAHQGLGGPEYRHRAGDWGEVDAADAAANDRAVSEGERVLSAYTLKDGTRLWVITEADRSSTCILLPDEY